MNDPHQPKLHYDDLDDALVDLVQALGGFKKVGPKLWPSLPQEDAAQRLRHSLNKSRREKLSHHETVALLRMGRELGFHNAKHFVDDETGYTKSQPIDPKQERNKAVEAVQGATEALNRALALLERASQPEPAMRLVK